MIPESIQQQINEREKVRIEIEDMQKYLAASQRKERKLTASIEAAYQGQAQKVAEALGVKFL